MKNLTKKMAMLVMVFTFAMAANAQTDLKSVLSGVVGKVTGGNSTVSSVLDNLIGTSKVSASSLVGTWTYSQPAVAFESNNAITQIGGAAATGAIESKLSSSLSKVGITPGKFSITFAKDNTFTATLKGKKVTGTYTVSGSTITFSKTGTKTKINANVKLGTTLQITFKADKLLKFAQQFGSIASTASSTLGTIINLSKNYSGMQLGMRFTK